MGLETAALITTGIATLAGTGMSIYGSIKEGNDAANAARRNADTARMQAKNIEAAGALDAQRQRKQAESLYKRQKALYGASGVTFSGSPMAVMLDTAAEAELDAQIGEYNTKINRNQALSQADYDDYQAQVYSQAGLFKAGSSLLTGASNFATNYMGYGYKKPSKYGIVSGGM